MAARMILPLRTLPQFEVRVVFVLRSRVVFLFAVSFSLCLLGGFALFVVFYTTQCLSRYPEQ